MNDELVFVGCVLALATFPFLKSRFTKFGNLLLVTTFIAALAVTALFMVSQVYRPRLESLRPVRDRPIEISKDGYVSSHTCRACHPHHYHTWHASYHRTMTQVASPKSVIGNFDVSELQFDGQRYQLERHNDQFWIEMPDPARMGKENEPSRIRKQIVMTTGSHHMQVYWYPTGETRKLGQVPLVYLKDERQWIPRNAAFLRPPEASFSQETARWNITCVRCHTTNGRGRIANPQNIETDVSEFGIACEACHGPAEQHVLRQRKPYSRYASHFDTRPDDNIVNPKRLPADTASQVCGQCHGIFEFYNLQDAVRWSEHGYPYRPGDDLLQTRIMVRHGDVSEPMMQHFLKVEPDYFEGRFWSDGMVRVSGREYNAMIESPCAKGGALSCLSCHSMHKTTDDKRSLSEWADDQLALGMNDNQACLQCHESFGQELQQHTRHSTNSSGSQCYNCHMPHTTYGLMKGIRSHQIDHPTVQSTLQTGRPNACNFCHLDQTLDWTATYLNQWYGLSKPTLDEEHQSKAASILWLLTGDAGQRALTAWSMGWEPAQQASGSAWMVPYLAHLLTDPYDTVRFIAYRSLRTIEGFEQFNYDFVSPPHQRISSREQALNAWMETPRKPETRTRLLFGESGTLDQDAFERLAQRRDDRAMNLKE